MADLRDLIDRFDRLVAMADGLAPADVLERAARVGRRVRDRRGFLGDTVVVALAGGTGSGKSSLINALAGEVVAEAGAQRPTTDRPLAWIPANPEPGLVRLLDSIDVTERVGQDVLPWLALIDLPDTDSVAEENRATVERVLPLVDAVVWVVDPEKYQDRVLHDRYLKPLSRHADRFRFVLNQVDRVASDDVEQLVSDLAGTLLLDGVDEPRILAMAVDPPLGRPHGIDAFIDAMGSLGDAKALVEAKLVTDLEEAATELVSASGVAASGTGFSEAWDSVRHEAARDVAADLIGPATLEAAGRVGARTARLSASIRGRRPDAVEVPVSPSASSGVRRAVDRVDRLLGELAETVGAEHAGPIRDVRSGIESAVSGAAETVGAAASIRLGPPPAAWQSAGWARMAAALAAGLGSWAVASAASITDPIAAVIGLVAAAAMFSVFGAVLARSGRAWARRAVEEADSQLVDSVARELDRRVGRPVRDALRVRAGLAAAHADFELIRSSLDRR